MVLSLFPRISNSPKHLKQFLALTADGSADLIKQLFKSLITRFNPSLNPQHDDLIATTFHMMLSFLSIHDDAVKYHALRYTIFQLAGRYPDILQRSVQKTLKEGNVLSPELAHVVFRRFAGGKGQLHPIFTICALGLAQRLARSRPETPRELARLLFTANVLMLQSEKLQLPPSNVQADDDSSTESLEQVPTFVPELIGFLHDVFRFLAGTKTSQVLKHAESEGHCWWWCRHRKQAFSNDMPWHGPRSITILCATFPNIARLR